ncbi:MAG TPA: hypothetical protein EYQ50_07310 [Verrucomicrobiales bacterium]|nr:hypothetical protein [Verrucomicrobiales bacterium]
MSKDMTFDDFILFDRLKKQLSFYDNNPQHIQTALCFHGMPGIGKTSFAKYLAYKHSKCVTYLDVKNTKHALYKDWHKEVGYTDLETLLDDTKYFDRAIILDEWGDMKTVQQEWWKVPIQEMIELPHTKLLIIICLNTSPFTEDKTHSLEKQMIKAIRSRCMPNIIDFCPKSGEEEDVVKSFMERFPDLDEEQFYATYPDIRAVIALGEQSKAMKEWDDKQKG